MCHQLIYVRKLLIFYTIIIDVKIMSHQLMTHVRIAMSMDTISVECPCTFNYLQNDKFCNIIDSWPDRLAKLTSESHGLKKTKRKKKTVRAPGGGGDKDH